MLEPGLLKVINFSFSLASALRVLPFHWDSTEFKFSPVSKWSRRITILLSIKLWIFFFFVTRQTFKRIGDGTTPGKLVFIQLLEMVRLLMGCTMQTSLLVQENLTVSYLNKVFEFNISSLSKKNPRVMTKFQRRNDKRDSCEDLIKLFLLAGFLQTGLAFLAFLRRPNMLTYYYSCFSDEVKNSYGFILRPIVSVSFLIDTVNYWAMVISGISIVVVSGTGTADWLKSITESSWTPLENIEIYRRLQILTIHFNACFGRFAVPTAQGGLILLNIILLFMTVRLHDHLPFNEFVRIPFRVVTTIVLNIYFFPMLADVQRLSTKFNNSRNYLPLSPPKKGRFIGLEVQKWNSKALRSSRPMKYGASAMFFMKKYYALRVFGFVVIYTAKLLMVF